MGFSYLGGLSWWQVTRDERFFCQRLFRLIEDRGAASFVDHVNQVVGLSLDVDAEWEPGFEVCFYRDLWFQRGKSVPLFSPKRTYDLCLLSDEEIVIIEAKAQQDFDRDQLAVFEMDRDRVQRLTGIRPSLVGLASSSCTAILGCRDIFDGPLLTWADLATFYGSDPVLQRADDIYDQARRESWGRNNTGGHMTGDQLLAAFAEGAELCVGRRGGLEGPLLAEDARSGAWRTRGYETASGATPPNTNWFRLEDFVDAVLPSGEARHRAGTGAG
jgi:hypothetical protein